MSTVKTNNVQIGQSVTATNNFTWYQPSSPDGTVRLGNGNSGSVTDLVTLTSAGNLGIGTSSPGYKLDVRGVVAGGNGTIVGGISYSSRAEIGAISNHNLGLIANNDTKAIIDTSGNLGLGVTPSAWASSYKALQIGTGASLSSTGAYTLLGQNFYNDGALKYISTGAASYYQQVSGAHSWYYAASGSAGGAISFTQAMTLDASGNLLVGTTSALGSQLGVMAQGGNGVSFTLRHSSATAGKFRLAGVDSSNNYLVYNNSNVGMYMTDGGTSWTATSDENQKLLTDKFVGAAQFLTTVRATRGRYKTDDETIKRSFLVAQDWQDYLPEAISEKDGVLGLSYQDTIPVLVAAIQEMHQEIQELKKRIN